MSTDIDDNFQALSASLSSGLNLVDSIRHHAKQMHDQMYNLVAQFIATSCSYNLAKFDQWLEDLSIDDEFDEMLDDPSKRLFYEWLKGPWESGDAPTSAYFLERMQKDQAFWLGSIQKIAKGDWPLKSYQTTLEPYAQAILFFYAHVHHNVPDDQIEKLLPLIMIMDERVAEINYFCGVWTGMGDHPITKERVRLKKIITNHDTKIAKWSGMISIIKNLYKAGMFNECENFHSLAEVVRDKMKELKKSGEIEGKDVHSLDTIKRCLTDVFRISAKSFKQPLTCPSLLYQVLS